MRVDIYLDIHRSFSTTLEQMIEKFPEEYDADKAEGLTDEEFVRRTFDEMGENYFEDIFGYGSWDRDLEIELYEE